jgi:hypothetical protein
VVRYWYFALTCPETQNISNFLCSIAKDLCSKVLTIPRSWKTIGQKQTMTSNAPLFEIFLIYCVLCYRILTTYNMECLHVLTVSRPEGDVQRAFKELSQTTGGLKEIWEEGLCIRRDIEEYLDSKFLSNSNCSRRQTTPKLLRSPLGQPLNYHLDSALSLFN